MRKKLNTLIVDDNDAFRQSLHRVLARHFPAMRVAEAADRHKVDRRTAAHIVALSALARVYQDRGIFP